MDILGLGTGAEVEKKLKYTEDVTSGIIFGKELVNSPANVLTPGKLAEEASKIASTYSDVLSANILNEEQCKELKMGSYLAVAAASTNPPHFIHLIYKPPGGPAKVKLGLVGKGLTFDSGGYNIKTGPGCSIEQMKFDMGGSAAVLGAAKAIAQIKPAGVEVHFIVAAMEENADNIGEISPILSIFQVMDILSGIRMVFGQISRYFGNIGEIFLSLVQSDSEATSEKNAGDGVPIPGPISSQKPCKNTNFNINFTYKLQISRMHKRFNICEVGLGFRVSMESHLTKTKTNQMTERDPCSAAHRQRRLSQLRLRQSHDQRRREKKDREISLCVCVFGRREIGEGRREIGE
ncbi:hypothetical protein ACFX2J_031449 [Malus domestica]